MAGLDTANGAPQSLLEVINHDLNDGPMGVIEEMALLRADLRDQLVAKPDDAALKEQLAECTAKAQAALDQMMDNIVTENEALSAYEASRNGVQAN